MGSMARVLVIDDREQSRTLTTSALSTLGFDAYGIGSDEARDHDFECDVALLDLMLSGMSGFDLARHIRQHRPTVRVVLTSEYHFSAHQLSRIDCGAVGFVPKPCDYEELAEFLRGKLASSAGAIPICTPGEPD
jgi:DNA-binding response OmpR family regulator